MRFVSSDPDIIPPAALDADNDTLTVAVTFAWRRPWALDKCEAGVVVGEMRRLIAEHFADWAQLGGVESVLSYDPTEECVLGSMNRPIAFVDGEPFDVLDDEDLARAELRAAVNAATYHARHGELRLLAEVAARIQHALARIAPAREGDSPEWTAQDRRIVLAGAIYAAGHQREWGVDELNQACTTALAITREKETCR